MVREFEELVARGLEELEGYVVLDTQVVDGLEEALSITLASLSRIPDDEHRCVEIILNVSDVLSEFLGTPVLISICR